MNGCTITFFMPTFVHRIAARYLRSWAGRALAAALAGLLAAAPIPPGFAQDASPIPLPSPGLSRSPLPLIPTPSPSPSAAAPEPGEADFANEGTLLKDYEVQPGDQLEVHLWGRDVDLTYPLRVSPQGVIFVPRLGTVMVNGRTADGVQRLLQQRVSRVVRGVQAAVLIRQVTRIKAYVTGQVARPGTYTVPALTRVQELINRAGGIIGNGSQRSLQLASPDGATRYLDLTRFSLQGNIAHNPFVRAGERVHVPFVRKRVALTGEVVRPGVYEVLQGETLRDIMALAGGPRAGAGLSEATVWEGGLNADVSRRHTVDLRPALAAAGSAQDVPLQDGDIVFLPASKNPAEGNVVYVYGSVGSPGSVPYRVGARLSDYINMAGGPLQNADLSGTRITPASAAGKATTSTVVDAYRIMYGGRFDQDPPLDVGTVVFVPERFFSFNNFADLAMLLNTTITLSTLIIGIINITR